MFTPEELRMRPLLLFLSASGASAQWGLGANVGYHAQPFSNVLLPWEPLTEAPATANPVDARARKLGFAVVADADLPTLARRRGN